MSPRLPRALLWLALGLAVVVIGASSGLRLAADGMGCDPWPVCYGRMPVAEEVQTSAVEHAVRLTHRFAASAFALAVLLAVALGWRGWCAPTRRAGLLLIGVTALLSVVGRFTPSTLPAVTLTNVIGGITLMGGTAYLLAADSPRTAAGPVRWLLHLLVVLIALQAATGATISIRSAGAACERGCAAEWSASTLRLWHPLESGSASVVALDARAGETLHAVHRLFAIFVVVATVGVVALIAQRRAASHRLLAALAACVVSGLALTVAGGALGAVVFHALGAGALAAGIGAAMAIRTMERKTR